MIPCLPHNLSRCVREKCLFNLHFLRADMALLIIPTISVAIDSFSLSFGGKNPLSKLSDSATCANDYKRFHAPSLHSFFGSSLSERTCEQTLPKHCAQTHLLPSPEPLATSDLATHLGVFIFCSPCSGKWELLRSPNCHPKGKI